MLCFILGAPISFSQADTVGNISDASVNRVQKRRISLNLTGWGFGPHWSRNLDSSTHMYAFSYTKHKEVSEHVDLRMMGNFALSDDADAVFLTASLGGSYFFSVKDISPLIGGSFGLGAADAMRSKDNEDRPEGVAGFTASVFAGGRLFRTATSQIEITLRAETLLGKNEKGFPSNYGLQLAILY